VKIGNEETVVLKVSNLCKYFPIVKRLTRRRVGTVKAVDGVSFFVRDGEAFGLVGESGCGKTTIARTILRALEPTSGVVFFDMNDGRAPIEVFELDRPALKVLRRHVRMVFQDPYSSLNPRMNVRELIAEPLIIHEAATSRSEIEERVAAVLSMVGLDAGCMRRYPHAFSGGQRQRISIARALILEPKFIIADEAVSALDVSVQAQILNLLQDLQEQLGLTYLFIAHNLAVVEHFCDRVGVMYAGRLVELAETEALFSAPRHPYTEALLNAVPRSEPGHDEPRELLKGEVADPANPPMGCYFNPRCKYAESVCGRVRPELRKISADGEPARYAACHRADSLELDGVTE